MRDTPGAMPSPARYDRAQANSTCVRWNRSTLGSKGNSSASSKGRHNSARCGRDRSGVTRSVKKEPPPPTLYPIRRRAPLSQSIRLSRTSMRPEKAKSNRRFRSERIVRDSEIQSREKGLYFRNRLKWRAQGTRTGMNSSTSPCPFRKEARAELTSREIRAVGKLCRRFLRKGTRMARSPKFQYSITRMVFGLACEPLEFSDGDTFSKKSRATASRAR